MLNYFKQYLSERGGEELMVALLNAYRGTFHLSRDKFWLDSRFFEAYPTIFKVSTTGKMLIKLQPGHYL